MLPIWSIFNILYKDLNYMTEDKDAKFYLLHSDKNSVWQGNY